MKTGKILLLGGIAAGAAFFYGRVKKMASDLKVSFSQVKFDNGLSSGAGYLKLFFKVTVSVNNPTNGSATLNGLYVTASLNGNDVASVGKNEKITIAPNATTKVYLTVQMSAVKAFGLLTNVYKIIAGKQPINIHLKGTADLNVGRVLIDETVKVEW